MTIIDWIDTLDGRRYRAWSTVSDTYYGPPMDRGEMLRWLVQCGHTEETAGAFLSKVDQPGGYLDHGPVEAWKYETGADDPW